MQKKKSSFRTQLKRVTIVQRNVSGKTQNIFAIDFIKIICTGKMLAYTIYYMNIVYMNYTDTHFYLAIFKVYFNLAQQL